MSDTIILSTQNWSSIQILSLACLIWPIAFATPNIQRVWRAHVKIYLLFREGDEKLCTSLATPSSSCLFLSTLIDQLKKLCRLYWQKLRLLKKELLCFEEYSCPPRRHKISPNTGKLRWWSRRIVHSLSPSLKEPGGWQDQDPGETFKGCASLTKAVFRYQWPGFQRAMLSYEYEMIQPSEGILIGQLSRVFHELQ